MKGSGFTIFFISFVLMAYLRSISAESEKMSFIEIREALTPLSKHCIERVGVDPKLVADVSNKGVFTPDRKLQCYFKCMMMNTKVMKNDKIVEKALKKIAEHMLMEESVLLVLEALEHCHSVAMKSMDGCQLAYEYIKCAFDYNAGII